MSRPTVDQGNKQNIGDSGICKFGCFDDVSKIFGPGFSVFSISVNSM